MAEIQTQKDVLVAIQRAEFAGASRCDRIQFRLQMLATCLAGGIFFVPWMKLEILLGVSAIGLVVAAAFIFYRGRSRRSLGERARRATLLVNGLGIRMSKVELMELGRRASVPAEELLKWNDATYFASEKVPGPERAAEMLLESAFWTEDLFDRSAAVMWRRVLVVSVFFVVIFLLALGWLGESNVRHELRIICALAPSFVWVEVVLRALSFQEGSSEVHDVLQGVERLEANGYPQDDLFVLLMNYNSAVESSPMIVSGVYEKNRGRLNRLFEEYIKNQKEKRQGK